MVFVDDCTCMSARGATCLRERTMSQKLAMPAYCQLTIFKNYPSKQLGLEETVMSYETA